jgi:micrococcal nuclease
MRTRTVLGLFGLILFLAWSALAADLYVVSRVIDGDTLLLNNGERVRLIGVDTPEVHVSKKLYKDAQRSQRDIKTIQALGKRASAFTRGMAQGKRVRLEYDQANAHLGHRDRYDRILAYVFLEDGTFLNAEIIRQGYGAAYTKYPFGHMEEFRRYEREAREQERGLWAGESLTGAKQTEGETELERAPPSSGQVTVYITKTGKKYHRGSCRYLSKSKIPISLEEAKARGYTPCSVCKPEQ